MSRQRISCLSLVLFALLAWARPAAADPEACGDGQDNDTDGLTDEGCYPEGITGICEDPLDCARTGSVSPATGALVYPVAPDLAPQVAYGPGIGFQRTYLSKYSTGYDCDSGAATSYKNPMGCRWHHNYMSWLTKNTQPDPDQVVVHMVTGQDVLFTYSTNASGYDYYVPQDGFHFDYLRQATASPYAWQLRTLTGVVYQYDWSSPTGKLTRIQDGVGNYVAISYNGDGQVQWVTDAAGTRKLKLSYQSSGPKLLEWVELYTNYGAGDTEAVQVELEYDGAYNLEYVSMGSTPATVAEYDYDGDGYLYRVKDGEATPKVLATFLYLTGGTGTIARIESPDGDVGYDYGACNGGLGTYVSFNHASTTACDADGDCGNYLCGGETNPAGADTGTCFLARRCVAFDDENEDLITAVSGSCASCTRNETYTWVSDAGSLLAELLGVESADDVWTSYLRNADGMVTTMVEGDTDADASTVPAGARATYYFYGDGSFPGNVTERRVKSALYSGTCDASTTTACRRTLYAYTAGGLVDTVQETGWTLTSSGSTTTYSSTTDYDYDGYGRLTTIYGPRASTADDVEFTYHTTAGPKQGYLYQVKRKKATDVYVTTTYTDYDYWGNATTVSDPSSDTTTLAYHADYNILVSREVDALGDEYIYTYDTGRRLTKIQRPKGNCQVYAYDGEGRLTSVTEKDYNSGTATCDITQESVEYTYSSPEGQLTKTEWKTSGGTVKKRQEQTYAQDRRLLTVINPVNTGYYKTWSYDDDGVPAQVVFEGTNAKTAWDVDSRNRLTSLRRYTAAGSSEDWAITQSAPHDGLPIDIVDEASHDIDLVWDDLGRKVKQITSEAGTRYLVYDEAGNLVTFVEAYGTGDQQTTTYTYDTLNRLLETDTGDADCFASGGAEIANTWDALPGGVSCPGGSTCANLAGRLARTKTVLWCDDSEGDDTFDQATFYSYDEAGRTTEHTVVDDADRSGRTAYTFDDNGNVTRIDYPAGSASGAVYDNSTSSYGTDDQPMAVKRDTTTILSSIRWDPAGKLDRYTQENIASSYYSTLDLSYNLAQRVTDIDLVARTSQLTIDYAEDLRGRYTQRVFGADSGGMRDMYFLYDDLSRVTCRRTTSGSTCPTSGTSLGENIAYNTSADRSTLYLRNSRYTDQQFTVSYSYQGDKAVTYTKPTSYRVDYTFDYLGNRTRDNDTEYSACSNPDQRDFYYDGRNNLVNVTSRYFLGGSTWHPYTVSYAYDEKDRMVFKSFVDDTTGDEAQWFFYWDLYDRLIQVKHVPDIGDQDTYSVFQWYWLETRPFLYYQIDYPSATTTRRYLASDEQNRPLAAWSWPSSGDTARVWEVDPGLFGWDEVKVGTGVYQPIRFPGQLYDDDTESYSTTTYCVSAFLKRPGVAYNHHRSYDSFTGTYLQVDPKVDDTWEPYTYVGQDPVMLMDVAGTSMSELSFGGSPTTRGGTEAPYDIVYDLVTESGDPDRGSCANAARGATRHVFMVVWGIRTEGRARMPLGAPPGMCSWWSGGRDWRYLQRNSR